MQNVVDTNIPKKYFSDQYSFVKAIRVMELSDELTPGWSQVSDSVRKLYTEPMSKAEVRTALYTQFGDWIITVEKIPSSLGALVFRQLPEQESFIGKATTWTTFPNIVAVEDAGLLKVAPEETLHKFWLSHCETTR